ncbi:permease prefix domain 1-containing protein [Diplocloster hominis]|uniref:permease prefix domain 1-containing protein n=1 Tax=Diplocloster hominis TaxID=3079010 RepID=UPI0031BA3838
MNENLKNYLDDVFKKAPKTRKALELKEELLSNSQDRYEDLIHSGTSEEDAYDMVVSSIGNVEELFDSLHEEVGMDLETRIELRKKMALTKTVATGLYILSFVVLLLFTIIDSMIPVNADLSLIGFMLMIIIDIVPTCMLVYSSSLYGSYKKTEDTIVEDFKEWQFNSKRNKSIRNAVSAVLWTLTLVLYFFISFMTFAWYATWIIFLAALCAQAVIILMFRLKEAKE